MGGARTGRSPGRQPQHGEPGAAGSDRAGPGHATPAGAYTVGPRLRVLTHALFRDSPRPRSEPGTSSAGSATACDATVMVALQSAQRATAFIALVHERPGPIRYHLIPGMTLPLHAGAAGRAILGAVGIDALDGDDELQQFSAETITDRQLLLAELDKAGHARVSSPAPGSTSPSRPACAAPFRLDSGIVGAVSVTRSRYETTEADLLRFGPLVAAAAERKSPRRRPPTTPPGAGASTPAGATITDTPGGSALNRIERLIDALIAHPDGLPATGRELAQLVGAPRHPPRNDCAPPRYSPGSPSHPAQTNCTRARCCSNGPPILGAPPGHQRDRPTRNRSPRRRSRRNHRLRQATTRTPAPRSWKPSPGATPH